ncbi:SDR family oxidoreductase [Chitinophaga nivalis]|uniref:SDR family oxidoreductase n=1 Tax=Chitinophaga nivalis TaxID=2991709 RepID=A0ABT3ITA9_9BACT|nr:SDR family oxidoreductase [Chitinophaga nivalis]MCW3463093.1 SDR family oxidoreductase [Chitinophaga nivalis]MCW3487217.1 SDR family oxidoreductase [Chitinophaga nivalis]
MTYKDKVILITGASSGIGHELALLLARQQARLILAARRQPALEAVRNECLLLTPYCEILPMDVTDETQIQAGVTKALQFFGKIDVLVNNAGVTQRSKLIDTTVNAVRQLMEVNFFGPVMLTKALLPHFREQGGGQVIVISSMAGLMGYPWRSGYNAAKHALQGYFETLQTEQPIPHLYTTLVCPGRIHTPITYAAVTANGEPYGKMDPHQAKGMPVTTCARRILKAMQQRKKLVLIAREEKILLWCKRYFPPLFYLIARKGN